MNALPHQPGAHTSGVILLDKPAGWTSRRAVNAVSRLFGRVKAGHAGTLDPLATGMLPVLLGEATRFAALGLSAEKSYEVSIDLARQTDTLDAEGEETARFDVRAEEADLVRALDSLRGDQQQLPPAFSAIRVDGRRAHELARRGEAPDMKPRRISIPEIRLAEWNSPVARVFVRCSKGTYIRALARDLGLKIGAGGCVSALRRLSCGRWPDSMMVDFGTLERRREAAVLSQREWLKHLPRLDLDAALARRLVQGQRLPVGDDRAEGVHAVFCVDRLLGTGIIRPGVSGFVLHPDRILPSAQERILT